MFFVISSKFVEKNYKKSIVPIYVVTPGFYRLRQMNYFKISTIFYPHMSSYNDLNYYNHQNRQIKGVQGWTKDQVSEGGTDM